MSQYCRYCSNCTISENTGGAYCDVKNKDISESAAKHSNKCECFGLIDCDKEYMDVFMESVYTPRKIKKQFKGQGSLF